MTEPRKRARKTSEAPAPKRCDNCTHFVAPDDARSAMRPDLGECHRYPMLVFADEDGMSYCWTPALPDEKCGEHDRRLDA